MSAATVRRHYCQGCQRLLPEGAGPNEVAWGPDPFASEIRGNDTEMWLCGSCYAESALDI